MQYLDNFLDSYMVIWVNFALYEIIKLRHGDKKIATHKKCRWFNSCDKINSILVGSNLTHAPSFIYFEYLFYIFWTSLLPYFSYFLLVWTDKRQFWEYIRKYLELIICFLITYTPLLKAYFPIKYDWLYRSFCESWVIKTILHLSQFSHF